MAMRPSDAMLAAVFAAAFTRTMIVGPLWAVETVTPLELARREMFRGR